MESSLTDRILSFILGIIIVIFFGIFFQPKCVLIKKLSE